MKRISLEGLGIQYKITEYLELHKKVLCLLEEGKIKPVKASGKNGKRPALYKEYWLIEEQEDFSKYKEELLFDYVPLISTEYYLKHIKQYVEDRIWVQLLNEYLKTNREKLQIPKSINERSFDIWHREKFLKEEQGKKILNRCGLSLENFNLYETTEPMAYYSHTKEVPQTMLIVENKDTFYSMRKFLLDGNSDIFGVKISTLIYGAGKGIYRSFEDFFLCLEPYMREENNVIYYLGDLDYEGILIYENLANLFEEEVEKQLLNLYYDKKESVEEFSKINKKEMELLQIKPFVLGYVKMLEKAKKIGISYMPEMKKGQNFKIGTKFFNCFSKEIEEEFQRLLKNGRYIPQEIVSLEDF